jgi:hypothetical protein
MALERSADFAKLFALRFSERESDTTNFFLPNTVWTWI